MATSYIGLMEIYRNMPKLSTIKRIAVGGGNAATVLSLCAVATAATVATATIRYGY